MGSELVAREREFDELLVHVDRGAGAVVCGEPGVGKTAIAAAVAARSAADGDLVERVVATVAARPIPFGALGPLLPEELTSLHPTFVLGAIVRRLREHRGRRLPLIVIDDGQFLDPQSAATVLGLATSGAARFLVTIRTGEHGPDAIRALWKEGVIPGSISRRSTVRPRSCSSNASSAAPSRSRPPNGCGSERKATPCS